MFDVVLLLDAFLVIIEQKMYDYLENQRKFSLQNQWFIIFLPVGRLFSIEIFSGISTKSSVFVGTGITGFGVCFTIVLVVLTVGTEVFTEGGDGERRLLIFDCTVSSTVFDITSGSYSGIVSI